MCEICRLEKLNDQARPSRRGLLRFFGAATAGLALAGTAAQRTSRPTQTAKCRVARCFARALIKGNKRYVGGDSSRHDFKREREALVGGQNPMPAS